MFHQLLFLEAPLCLHQLLSPGALCLCSTSCFFPGAPLCPHQLLFPGVLCLCSTSCFFQELRYVSTSCCLQEPHVCHIPPVVSRSYVFAMSHHLPSRNSVTSHQLSAAPLCYVPPAVSSSSVCYVPPVAVSRSSIFVMSHHLSLAALCVLCPTRYFQKRCV